eukprot:gnl/TRDRNA2_/TRDRNA2_151308_c0_seq2.p1 gnl/TRDRNA2_/TRDRNA2_151308_c0~~gnl/TRDRNA2_/TRDRNA2_151308_c0_seq2.p1  ORF type:complete len:418 (+),score=82.48 gnl/TRDRNA2_/TRDRNA2_151308_c0_seq2:566-1819(+)
MLEPSMPGAPAPEAEPAPKVVSERAQPLKTDPHISQKPATQVAADAVPQAIVESMSVSDMAVIPQSSAAVLANEIKLDAAAGLHATAAATPAAASTLAPAMETASALDPAGASVSEAAPVSGALPEPSPPDRSAAALSEPAQTPATASDAVSIPSPGQVSPRLLGQASPVAPAELTAALAPGPAYLEVAAEKTASVATSASFPSQVVPASAPEVESSNDPRPLPASIAAAPRLAPIPDSIPTAASASAQKPASPRPASPRLPTSVPLPGATPASTCNVMPAQVSFLLPEGEREVEALRCLVSDFAEHLDLLREEVETATASLATSTAASDASRSTIGSFARVLSTRGGALGACEDINGIVGTNCGACSLGEVAGLVAERRAFEEWLQGALEAAAAMLDERDNLRRLAKAAVADTGPA